MSEPDEEFSITPGTGVRAFHNANGGITLEPFEGPNEHIELSHTEALALADWLRAECSRES